MTRHQNRNHRVCRQGGRILRQGLVALANPTEEDPSRHPVPSHHERIAEAEGRNQNFEFQLPVHTHLSTENLAAETSGAAAAALGSSATGSSGSHPNVTPPRRWNSRTMGERAVADGGLSARIQMPE